MLCRAATTAPNDADARVFECLVSMGLFGEKPYDARQALLEFPQGTTTVGCRDWKMPTDVPGAGRPADRCAVRIFRTATKQLPYELEADVVGGVPAMKVVANALIGEDVVTAIARLEDILGTGMREDMQLNDTRLEAVVTELDTTIDRDLGAWLVAGVAPIKRETRALCDARRKRDSQGGTRGLQCHFNVRM